MKEKIKIILVEDEYIIREGIKTILEQESNFEVVKEFENGEAFVKYIETTNTLPDVVLMDIKMPNLNGVEATKRLNENFPELKIVALSSYNSDVFISNMLEVGAVSYVPKSATPDTIILNINKVVENGFYYDESIMSFVSDRETKNKSSFDTNYITQREKDVLKFICQQKSATEIGDILNISSRTVDGHRNNLLLKTESKNVVGLVLFAIKNNLFLPEIDS